MSTNINITVGDNALLDRAKQQQSANRQAQLNREASTRLEAQAEAARTAAFAAQGRDANGNPIFGAPFTQPQIDRRPAANRSGGGGVGLYWFFEYDAQKEVPRIGTYEGGNPALGASVTTPGQSRPWYTDYLYRFGCANGSQWIDLLDGPQSDEVTGPVSGSGSGRHFRAYEESLSPQIETYYEHIALPIKGDKFILLVNRSHAWRVIQYEAEHYDDYFWGAQPNDPPLDMATAAFYTDIIDTEGNQMLSFYDPKWGEPEVFSARVTLNASSGYKRTVSAYVVSATTIREIAIPAALNTVLDVVWPTEPLAFTEAVNTYMEQRIRKFHTYPTFPFSEEIQNLRTAGQLPYTWFFEQPGFYFAENYEPYGLAHTPEIYRRLNLISPFSADATLEFPSDAKWAIADRGIPPGQPIGYQAFAEYDLAGRPFGEDPLAADLYESSSVLPHALWPQAGVTPNMDGYYPAGEEIWPTGRPTKLNKITLSPSRPDRSESLRSGLNAVYDWGKPGYCKQMLTALGFTGADLTP